MCTAVPSWLNWALNPSAPMTYAAKKIGGDTAAMLVDPVSYAISNASGKNTQQQNSANNAAHDLAKQRLTEASASSSPFNSNNA